MPGLLYEQLLELLGLQDQVVERWCRWQPDALPPAFFRSYRSIRGGRCWQHTAGALAAGAWRQSLPRFGAPAEFRRCPTWSSRCWLLARRQQQAIYCQELSSRTAQAALKWS